MSNNVNKLSVSKTSCANYKTKEEAKNKLATHRTQLTNTRINKPLSATMDSTPVMVRETKLMTMTMTTKKRKKMRMRRWSALRARATMATTMAKTGIRISISKMVVTMLLESTTMRAPMLMLMKRLKSFKVATAALMVTESKRKSVRLLTMDGISYERVGK